MLSSSFLCVPQYYFTPARPPPTILWNRNKLHASIGIYVKISSRFSFFARPGAEDSEHYLLRFRVPCEIFYVSVVSVFCLCCCVFSREKIVCIVVFFLCRPSVSFYGASLCFVAFRRVVLWFMLCFLLFHLVCQMTLNMVSFFTHSS